MTPYLPQNDPEPAKRQDWLERNQKDYEFNLDYLPPLPLLKNLPVFENFSTTYLAEVGLAAAKLTTNSLAVKFQSLWDPLNELQDYEDFFPVLPKPNVIQTYQTDNSFAEQRLSGVNPMVLSRLKEIPPHFQFNIQEVQAKFGQFLNVDQELRGCL